MLLYFMKFKGTNVNEKVRGLYVERLWKSEIIAFHVYELHITVTGVGRLISTHNGVLLFPSSSPFFRFAFFSFPIPFHIPPELIPTLSFLHVHFPIRLYYNTTVAC